jgi:hypothetical protein
MDNGVVKILRWVLIALGVLLLLAILILLFTRNGNNQQKGTESQQVVLDQYATNGTFRFVQNGPVEAPENQNSVTISISNSSRNIAVYSSYGETVVNSKNYSNTQASFDAFSDALTGAGFTNTRSTDINYSTFCNLGIRYSYQVLADSNMKLDSWNSSCNPKNGSFAGNSSQVQQLFKLQIPDYNQIMNSVNL